MKTATMPACRALPTAAAWPAAPHQLHPALGLLRLRDQGAVRPLEHKFDNRWKAKLNVSRVETELDRFWVYMGGAITRRHLAGAVWRGGHIQSGNTQEVVDLSLGGPFQLMGRTHELLLGRGTGSAWKASGKAPISRAAARGQHPFCPQHLDAAHGNLLHTRYGPWGQKQMGGYGVLRLHPTDRLAPLLGARASRYDSSSRSGTWMRRATARPGRTRRSRNPPRSRPMAG